MLSSKEVITQGKETGTKSRPLATMTSLGAILNLSFVLFISIRGCLGDLAISDGSVTSGSPSSPMWKQLFRNYRTWIGVYEYKGMMYHCDLNIMSVQDKPNGTIIATLEDQNYAVVDMEGISYDDRLIYFKSVTIFNATDIFPLHTEVAFQGNIRHYHEMQVYWFDANFTSPKNKGFTMLQVMAKLSSGTKKPATFDSVNIGLAIGVPTTLAIVLTATGIGLVLWAVKKGYIRHVASNYNRFDRPNSSTDVQFENNNARSGGGTVHI